MSKVKALILCEGDTDRDLLGMYIEGKSSYRFCNDKKIRSYFSEKPIVWYKNSTDEVIGIWSVGCDCFDPALGDICSREKLEKTIEKILIITDHDDTTTENKKPRELYKILVEGLVGEVDSGEQLVNDNWITIKYSNSFAEYSIEVGYLLVPKDEEGALETYMLKALTETNPEQKDIINQAKRFIEELKSDIYLKKRRDKTKAVLGVSISVFNPERSFIIMNELIKSVDWTKYDMSNNQFAIINDILQ